MDEFAGIRIGQLIAGFAGAVISLSYLRPLTKLQATSAVFTGAFTAAYITPLAVQYLGFGPRAENATAFILGLCAMNIIPGVLRLSAYFRNHPLDALAKRAPPRDKGDQS